MLSFPKQTGRRIVIAFIVSSSLIGCGSMARYKILTFFFDGVPLPGSDEPELTATDNIALEFPTQEEPLDLSGPRQGPSRHKPTKDCQRCHAKGSQWNRKQFKKPIPNLCYDCHTDYTLSPAYVHGPVAVGACLFCHEAHESRYNKLLKEPMPKLCYQCHEEEIIFSVEIHQENPKAICTKCHDPHISFDKKMLRSYGEVMDEPETHNLIK